MLDGLDGLKKLKRLFSVVNGSGKRKDEDSDSSDDDGSPRKAQRKMFKMILKKLEERSKREDGSETANKYDRVVDKLLGAASPSPGLGSPQARLSP